MEKKTVLLLAGGGTIGTYTAKELLKMGYRVKVVAKDGFETNDENFTFQRTEIDDAVLQKLFAEQHFNAIVDFLHYDYPERDYTERSRLLLKNCDHLIFLSSYRVYADEEHPIRETSPQLLDVSKDEVLLANERYGLSKSKCERILQQSEFHHWTAVRPLISFSNQRFDLITTQGSVLLNRTREKKKILLPLEAKNVVAGLGWAGNIGKMIARLILNEKAYGEAYTLGTGEVRTWGEIAQYYTELMGAEFVWIPREEYLQYATPNEVGDAWGLDYDRLLNRTIDNSKLLDVTGLKKEDFVCIREALEMELNAIPEGVVFRERLSGEEVRKANEKMDQYLRENGSC